jgi:hypothetical protein
MLARYGFLNADGSMLTSGGPPDAMRETPDPVMDMAFSLLDRVGPKPREYSSEEAAVAAAFEKEARAVVSELMKRKQ